MTTITNLDGLGAHLRGEPAGTRIALHAPRAA